MSKIDDKTSIPLWWVAVAGVSILTWTWVGATWVKGVDDRLSRIETKLGIPGNEAVSYGPSFIQKAEAKDSKK